MTAVANAVIAVSILAGIFGSAEMLRNHFIAKGDAAGAARIQAVFDQHKLDEQARQLAEQARRNAEVLAKFRNTERVIYEQEQKLATMAGAKDAAVAAVRSLRIDIARQNNRAVPAAGACADPRVATLTSQATTARELLGQCAERYQAVAATADELGAQVGGLLSILLEKPESLNQP